MTTYRVGNHNPRNLYRDDEHFGVVFDPADGPLVVSVLNFRERAMQIWGPVDGDILASSLSADSCTGCTAAKGDPGCPVHHGRKPRGPKPPPLGPGCICDGSGRTCPRHGAVI